MLVTMEASHFANFLSFYRTVLPGCSKFYGTINGEVHPVSNGPKGSLEDAYECNLTEALQAELLADGLQGAPLDALKEDAHIFEAGSKLLLAIPRVLL